MKRKLYVSIFLFTFILLLIFAGILGLVSFKVYENQLNSNLRNIATIIKIDKDNGLSLRSIKLKYNNVGSISFIDQDGNLITNSDSGINASESLLARTEVKEALKTGEGSSIRFNEDSNQYFFYKAFKVSEDILLIGVPIISFSDFISGLAEALLLVLILTAILGSLLSHYFNRTNIKPIETLEKYVKKKAKDDSVTEVEIQNLPYELKVIAKTFKKTKYKLKKVAKKEQDKKMYLLTTINSMEDGFIAIDDNDTIKLINKSALNILDINRSDSYKENILMVTQNMDLFTAINTSGDTASNQEITIDDKIFEVSIIPISECKGKLILLNDITDLNKIESIRKEFVANVTHELKTPLTSIKGYIETLKDDGFDDKEKANKFLEIIVEEGSRLERLIDDILILSNIENMKEIKKENINIKEEIEKVFRIYEDAAKIKNIELVKDIEENMFLNLNKELFKIMLSNLTSNGIKYGNINGKVTINSYCKNNKAIIEVIDDGIGIPENDQERIFERFYKVDKSRSVDPESTGLGLSIVKHIVKSFLGTITLESKINEGTKFIIEIPVEGRK